MKRPYQCVVYCLFKPGEEHPFYFGQTTIPVKRKNDHERKYGRDIRFVILKRLNCGFKASVWERHYIRAHEALGLPLLNKQKTLAHEANMTAQRRKRAQAKREARESCFIDGLGI